MSLGYQSFLPQEVTLEHKSLLSLIYSNMDKYSFMFQQFVIQQFEINYRKIKQLETEGKIGPNTWILFDRSKNDFWLFTWLNVKDSKERKELARFYKATSASFDMYDRFDYELYFTCKKETMIQRQKERSRPEEKEIPQGYLEQLWDIYDDNIEKIYPNYIRIPTDIRDPYYMIRSLFIHEAKGLRKIEEKPITPSMNEYIKNLPIIGYTLITLFKLSNSKYQVLAARRSMTT
ncbi:hypothetical protein C2G38_2199858 [Gigaspora rosea]|uniref:Deoxynucleoside kinase domain-containing protein n=1 Tax=Gigaspora rosea TaxID=44941 RepID=A0A397UT00_9GLOM|nr:hypothetical protein C2G38_2199858 [Gigaspora rosea]